MTGPGTTSPEPLVPCAHHPSRRADQPCARCGTFVCDWCIKLAPSWGPGLCLDCQKRAAGATPRNVPLTRGFLVVGAGMLICPFMTWNELVATRKLSVDPTVDPQGVTIAVVVLVLTLVWNVVGLVLFALRRPQARAVLLGFFGFRGLVSIVGVVASHAAEPGGWMPVLVNAALFFYVGWSADSRVVFGRPGEVSAAELLEKEPPAG